MSIRSVEFVARKIQELPSTQVERYLATYVLAVRLDEARTAFLEAISYGRPGGDAVTKLVINRLGQRVSFLQRRAK